MDRRFKDAKGDIHFLMQGEPEEGWEEIFEDFNQLPDPNYRPPYNYLRMAEYPPIEDYIDGVVKGDQAQIDDYIAKCQAVKAKYPKPTA